MTNQIHTLNKIGIVKNKDDTSYYFTHYYVFDNSTRYFIGTMYTSDGNSSCCVSSSFIPRKYIDVIQLPNFSHNVLAYKKLLLDLEKNNPEELDNHSDLLKSQDKSNCIKSPTYMVNFYHRMDKWIPEYIEEYAEKFSKRFNYPKKAIKEKLESRIKHIDFMPIDYLKDVGGYWLSSTSSIHVDNLYCAMKLSELLDHEFTHVLTEGDRETPVLGYKMRKCGFFRHDGGEYRALNEGATEWIAAQTTGRPTLTYYFDVGMFKCVKDLVGEKETVKAFLKNDITTVLSGLLNTFVDWDYPRKMLTLMDKLHISKYDEPKAIITQQQSQTYAIVVGFVEQLEKVVKNAHKPSKLTPILACVKNNFNFLNDNITLCDGTNKERMAKLYFSILEKYKEFGINRADIMSSEQDLEEIKIPDKNANSIRELKSSMNSAGSNNITDFVKRGR